jgi:DNA (cytosine-5)-methyltransferase 1
VPQRRERVFFCAVRNDIDVPPLQLAPAHRWISAGEACVDVQDLTDAERKDTDISMYAIGAEAKKLKAGKSESRYFSLSIVDKNNPSPCLTAAISGNSTASAIHWTGDRNFTYREAKRLGSFPDDYQAKSDKIGKYMIGMSVPPKMTQAVAEAVISQWLRPVEGSV